MFPLIESSDELLDLVKEIVNMIKPLISILKELMDFLISEPTVAFLLSFLLMLAVVKEAFSRGKDAPFSTKTATVIALCLALYGATTLANKLPLIGKLAAYALIIALPLVLFFRFFGSRGG
jgi:membrane-bound ClpP family serine protease